MLEKITQRAFRKGALLAYGSLLLVVASCQIVADIQSRRLDPPPPDGGVCNFPSYLNFSGPSVRIANLVPTTDVVDICMRSTGDASWGRPLLFNGGTSCGAQTNGPPGSQGFKYEDVSMPFPAPSATIDVRLIAGGSPDCSDQNVLTEQDNLTLSPDSVTTLVRFGSGKVQQFIKAMPEENTQNGQTTRLRFVHAMPGVGPLDFGLTSDKHLPSTVQKPVLDKPVNFGFAATQGQKSINVGTLDARGYDSLPAVEFNVIAEVHGTTRGLLLEALTARAETLTLFAIGVAGDNLHPLQGLLCNDGAADSKNPLLAACSTTPLPDISVDVWDPALYGPNSPYYNQRDKDLVLQPLIQKRDADFMCMLEVDTAADQGVIATAAPQYPATYAGPPMTLDTPFTYGPNNQNGQAPPMATTPPCANVPQADIDAAIQCMGKNCSTTGTTAGKLNQGTACLASNCAQQLVTVQGDSVACYDCVLTYSASGAETYDSTETRCTTDVEPPMAYEGLNNSMILSKYPFVKDSTGKDVVDTLVLPSTGYRRSVLYAKIQLEDQTVDFYCGFLMTTLIYEDLPYDGFYGVAQGQTSCDKTGDECYKNEQLFEAQQLIKWVHDKSKNDAEYPAPTFKGRPAIIVGEWRSSAEVPVAGTDGGVANDMVLPLIPETMALLSGATGWTAVGTPAAPLMGWTPQCTYCPTTPVTNDPAALTNPYNSTTTNYFTAQPFLYQWPGNAKTAAFDMSLVYTDQTAVTLPPGTMPPQGPPSPYYGVNMHVLRPNASN